MSQTSGEIMQNILFGMVFVFVAKWHNKHITNNLSLNKVCFKKHFPVSLYKHTSLIKILFIIITCISKGLHLFFLAFYKKLFYKELPRSGW